jgi:hypothetical protein
MDPPNARTRKKNLAQRIAAARPMKNYFGVGNGAGDIFECGSRDMTHRTQHRKLRGILSGENQYQGTVAHI